MIEQAAYDATARALWHHRHRASDALALLDEVLAEAERHGIDVDGWRVRAGEIRERRPPSPEQLDTVRAVVESMLADAPDSGWTSCRPRPDGGERHGVHEHTDVIEGPTVLLPPMPAALQRPPAEPATVRSLRGDEPPEGSTPVERVEQLVDAGPVLGLVRGVWRDVEVVDEHLAPGSTSALVAYTRQGREYEQRLTFDRLRLRPDGSS